MDSLKKIYGYKYFWHIAILVLIGGIVLYNKDAIMKKLSGEKDTTNPDPAKPNAGTTSTSSTGLAMDKALKNGTKGAEVKQLQVLLNSELTYRKSLRQTPTSPVYTDEAVALANEPRLVEDGDFGAKTEARLNLFTGAKTTTLNEIKAGNKLKHLSGTNYQNVIAQITNPLGTTTQPTNTGGASGSW
jgi:peptidoglycan hydrolase-like protein with peptidoglycan-binding domain